MLRKKRDVLGRTQESGIRLKKTKQNMEEFIYLNARATHMILRNEN